MRDIRPLYQAWQDHADHWKKRALKAEQQLAEAQRDAEMYRSLKDNAAGLLQRLAAEKIELERQLAEALKDAERYQWLRQNAYVFGSTNPVGDLPEEPVSLWLLGSTDMTDAGIDAAIDNDREKG